MSNISEEFIRKDDGDGNESSDLFLGCERDYLPRAHSDSHDLPDNKHPFGQVLRRRKLIENTIRSQHDTLHIEIDNIEDTRGMSYKDWISQRNTENEIRF